MTEIRHPEWRAEQEPSQYPFQDEAALVNDAGDVILADIFLDAAFYPVGGKEGGYLSKIVISATTATLYYGDSEEAERAFGEFELADPPAELRFVDEFGRPAGLIVSEAIRMSVFQSWGVGEHLFEADQTGYVAACCMPTPELGVRGVILDDGSVLFNDVYLVGDNGIVLSCEQVTVPGTCNVAAQTQYVIRVDVVGDPLWRRRECSPGFFSTPRFLETITFQQGDKSFTCGPGNYGDIKIAVGNQLAEDTILRIRSVEQGVIVEAVGERLESR